MTAALPPGDVTQVRKRLRGVCGIFFESTIVRGKILDLHFSHYDENETEHRDIVS